MQSPKYSILIPTRNGANYVLYAIKSILNHTYASVEVIVSVNHSSDDTLSVVSGIQDRRLTVIIPPEPLSMAKHYEWCLCHANGEWVTILGDDDALLPWFFEVVDELLLKWERKSIDAVSFRRVYYFWDGCQDVFDSVIDFAAQKKEHLISGGLTILATLLGAKKHYDLPQIYTNNIVKRQCIINIKERCGGFFYHELTPDVYSGVAVALSANRILRSEYPVFWTGTSPKSVGMAFSSRTNDQGQDIMFDGEKIRSEFLTLAEKDGLGISAAIDRAVWMTAQAGPIFVLSALFKYPLLSEIWIRFRHYLIALSFIEAKRQIRVRKKAKLSNVNELRDLMCNNLATLGIGRLRIAIAVMIIKAIRVWVFGIRIKSFVLRRAGLSKEVKYASNAHDQFPDIICANEFIDTFRNK